MKAALLFAPNLALLVVIFRLAGGGWRERPSIFYFLIAWFFYSTGTHIAGRVWGDSSEAYARFYLCATAVAWIFAVYPLMTSTGAALKGWWAVPVLATGVVGVCVLLGRFLGGAQAPVPALALGFTCWGAAVMGLVFLLASIHDAGLVRTLHCGVGIYLLVFGGGVLLGGAVFRTASVFLVVAALCAVVWLVLAARIEPRGDALFNLEKLAVVPLLGGFASVSAPTQTSAAKGARK